MAVAALPAVGYFTGSITNLQAKTAQNDILAFLRANIIGGGTPSELTIAAGSVTPISAVHSIDTESNAASDDLDRMAVTNVQDGGFVLIRQEDDGRDIRIRHAQGGSGQFALMGSTNYQMSSVNDWLLVQLRGTTFYEVMRAAFNPAVPGAIGGTTPAAGAFTTLSTSGAIDAVGNITITNTAPGFWTIDSDQGTNEKRWLMFGSAAKWRLFTADDAGSLGTAAIEISRSGTTPGAHVYTGTSFAMNGGALTLSTGGITLTNGGLSATDDVIITSNLPRVIMYESDAALNEKRWLILATGGDLWLGATASDASSSGVIVPITIKRTGTAVDSIDLQASSGGYIKVDSTRVLLGNLAASFSSDSYLHIPVGSATLGAITTESTGTSASRKHIYFRNSNGEVGSISTSGTATAYTTSSDYRLKKVVSENVPDAIEKIKALTPRLFKWNNDIRDLGEENAPVVMGFIAHELQEVFPDAVVGVKDEEHEIEKEVEIRGKKVIQKIKEPVYQGVDQGKLTSLLTAGLKDLISRVEALEGRI